MIQAPEIINCSSYSGDHTHEENLQQIHKMDKNKINFINSKNSSSTHLSSPVGYKSWQHCHKELYSTKTRCIPQESRLTQYHTGKSQWWNGHLESSSDYTSDENDSKCEGTETVHNGMKGHFNRVVLVPTTPYKEKVWSLNENHLTERKANKFAQVCKIWGAFETMKADGMSS